MNLGQSMMVIVGLALLGLLALSANTSVMESSDISSNSEFGVTAISLASSLIQEAFAKSFDQKVVTAGAVSSPSEFTPRDSLGAEVGEEYRSANPANDYNDFDDFSNILIVYTSPLDTAAEAGATRQLVVPGIRARFLVSAQVEYVNSNDLDVVSVGQTWHKRMIVRVTSPTAKDTVVVPAVMSYWN